jgi:hypothetical protein
VSHPQILEGGSLYESSFKLKVDDIGVNFRSPRPQFEQTASSPFLLHAWYVSSEIVALGFNICDTFSRQKPFAYDLAHISAKEMV